ncbi:MAG TPA: hypothetical protein DCG28_00520 [Lachnospiraceae bacterium]|nr:hypothetical protein [Lachnospiraceae bacterium]
MIKERMNKVLTENGVLQVNWKDPEYDRDADLLIKYRDTKVLKALVKVCKRYNCSADYILGLSDRYWGG